MGFNSNIEWTNHTFNPWWGCTKVSDGCKSCYAEALAKRYGHRVWGSSRPRRLMSDNHWKEPIKWNAEAERRRIRYRVFCASMADVFEENAPEGQLERLWEVIRRTPNLDWQILTKRPHRISNLLPSDWGAGYENVWLGTSVEDDRVIERVPHLIAVPAVIHFLSLEPLIGPLPNLPMQGIDWVIVGGESGPRSRLMEESWVLDIRRQCSEAGVPFFFKQWGGVRKKEAGRKLQDEFYNEMPKIRRRRQKALSLTARG
jgi:protein gp37